MKKILKLESTYKKDLLMWQQTKTGWHNAELSGVPLPLSIADTSGSVRFSDVFCDTFLGGGCHDIGGDCGDAGSLDTAQSRECADIDGDARNAPTLDKT